MNTGQTKSRTLSRGLVVKNRSNARSITSGVMPVPVSVTQIERYCPGGTSRSLAARSSSHLFVVSISAACVASRSSGSSPSSSRPLGACWLIGAMSRRPASADAGEQVIEVMRDTTGYRPTASIFCAWRNARCASASACACSRSTVMWRAVA